MRLQHDALRFPDVGSPIPPNDVADRSIVLIVTHDEWWLRSLESLLTPAGYTVVPALSGRQALEMVGRSLPDAIIIQDHPQDIPAIELCRTLLADTALDPCIPIVLTSAGVFSREERLEAVRAGVWDCYGLPIDVPEFLAKLTTYSKAKRESDRARTESLVAQGTNLYSAPAMHRLAQTLSALSARRRVPLACVAIGAEDAATTDGEAPKRDLDRHQLMRRLLRLLPVACRTSDVVGLLDRDEIAVLAMSTSMEGAVRLAERVLATVDSIDASAAMQEPGEAPIRLVAGCAVFQAGARGKIDGSDLLVRARTALQRVQHQRGASRIEYGAT